MATAKSMTLRQKITEGEQLAKELLQHLEQGFLPKAQHVRRITRPSPDSSEEELRDVTIRNAVSEVISSDDFTRRLTSQLKDYLELIETDVARIVHEG